MLCQEENIIEKSAIFLHELNSKELKELKISEKFFL